MAGSLHLVTSEAPPDLGEESEIIVVQTDEGDGEGELVLQEYGFTTTLVSNYADLDELRADVAEWWKRIAGVTPILELLATDNGLMSEDQQRSIAELEPSSWSVRNVLTAFKRDSLAARAEARRLVLESCMKVH